MLKFAERIKKAGINPYVDIPVEVSKAFSKRGNIPVKGTLNGFPIRATLVSLGDGRHRLYINTAMRMQAGAGVGDTIKLMLEIDTEPRVHPMPKQLLDALENNPEAKDTYEKLPPSHRNEYLAYLNSLKKPESIERIVKKIIRQLEGKGRRN